MSTVITIVLTIVLLSFVVVLVLALWNATHIVYMTSLFFIDWVNFKQWVRKRIVELKDI